jgi:predicted lipoprotein with Yx(FWY)xxD motif
MMGRRHTFAAAMVLGSLALVSASCGSTRGRSAAAPPAVGASKPVSADTGTVAVASSSLGDVLVDAQGRTVYLFGADTGTKSACSGACALSWPPLVASGTPTVGNGAATSLVATATRTDGAQQVVYNGRPLYLFAGDQKAGDTNGQGVNAFGGSWYALTATGNQVTATPPSTGGGNGY